MLSHPLDLLGSLNLGTLPPSNPGPISVVPALLLILLYQIPQIQFTAFSHHVHLAILFQICRGTGRGLGAASRALLSPPSWLSHCLPLCLLPFPQQIDPVVSCRAASSSSPKPWGQQLCNLPRTSCHSRLIKAMPNTVGLSL